MTESATIRFRMGYFDTVRTLRELSYMRPGTRWIRRVAWAFVRLGRARHAWMLAAVLSSLGCDRRTWTGPLSTAADSVMPVRSGCEVVATFDYELTDIERPVSSCVVSHGDTTFMVIADDGRRVLTLSRMIRVDPARQAIVHDSLEFHVASQSQYEAPRICAETGDPSATEVRRWSTLDRQIVLKNVGTDRVLFQLRGDHPKCEAAEADYAK